MAPGAEEPGRRRGGPAREHAPRPAPGRRRGRRGGPRCRRARSASARSGSRRAGSRRGPGAAAAPRGRPRVTKSAPAHQSGIAMKEEKAKGNWPGSGKARLGATVSARARPATPSAARLARRPPLQRRRRGRRRRGRRRRPGWRARRPRRRATASVAAAGLQAAQRGEAEGDAEGEGELAVGEQGDDAGGEPERRPARLDPPAVADQAVEEVGGGDDRERRPPPAAPAAPPAAGRGRCR